MILVTGGTGLVGSHLLYKLVVSGEKPTALRRSSSDISIVKKVFSYYSDNPDILFNRINWVKGDILNYYEVLDAMEEVNHVYHAAASVSFQSSDKQNLIDTNIIGTANVVNAALEKKIDKLLHVSTIGALGRADASGIVTEETQWNSKKSSVYSTSKYHAEMEVWRGIAEGLNAVIINPAIILGPGNWDTGSSKLFSTMYNGLPFYSTGTNGFVDVEDVAQAMILLMNNTVNGERFIINSENITYKQLFTWMADSLQVEPPKYQAGKILSDIGWRALWVKSLFTGKKSSITKETAETANQLYNYSNKKIIESTGIKFINIKDSLAKNAKLFLKDCNKI